MTTDNTINVVSSWGNAASQALRHPLQSGASSVGVGAIVFIEGALTRDPALMGLGAGLEILAGTRLARFMRDRRHLQPAPVFH